MESKGSLGEITLQDFFTRPALIMIIAGILMLIGSVGTWHHSTGVRAIVGFMGLILLYSSVVNLGYVRFLENVVAPLSVSAICGVLALIGSIGAWSEFAGGDWGLYVTVVAAFVSLFAAFRAYQGAGGGARRSRGGGGL